MGLYRRGKIWHMLYTVDGVQKRESTHTRNKSLAQRAYAKVMTEVEEGRWFERKAKSKTLGELIEKYEEEYSKDGKYYARDKSTFKHLLLFFGKDCKLGNIERTIGSYEKSRTTGKKGEDPVKAPTVLKELGLFSSMFKYARTKWNWKMPNPVDEIQMPAPSEERVRYLLPHELKASLVALDEVPTKWLKPMVIVDLNTGLRLTRLCELRWSEVDLSARIITIDGVLMKNKHYLGIPINDDAYKVLKELEKNRGASDRVFHDNGKPLYVRKVQRALAKALKIAKITDFHFHDQRHTFASFYRRSGIDVDTIGELLGNKDHRSALRYAHLNVDNLHEAVSKGTITNLSQSDVINGEDQVVPTGVEPVS